MEKISRLTRLHFVLDRGLLKKLLNESNRLNVTVSEMIEIIWQNYRGVIERRNFIKEDWNDEEFNENELRMTETLRITINPEFKRQLFIIQGIYSLRSKAGILRFMIREYFKLMKKITDAGIKAYKKVFISMWEYFRGRKREFLKAACKHMDSKNTPYFTCTYNAHLELTKITYIGT